MNIKPFQIVLAFFAIVIVAVVAFATGGKDDSPSASSGTQTEQTAPAGSTVVEFAYSPEKKALLLPLIAKYNSSNPTVNGKRVFVQGKEISSGEAERKIADGSYKPTVWSPAGSLWGRLVNFDADQELAADENPSIVRTPLVIAMWKNQAEALGWPKKKIGFDDLQKLSTSTNGWASVGHPEFGDFKLVHTNPDFSTAGLEATVAEYYAATGKKEGLTVADISGKARTDVQKLEKSIIHYGDTTVFVADQLVKEGPSYASAAIMEETTVLDVNRRSRSRQLVALYPKEGTFFSDSPYIILNGSWVTADARAGAEGFQKFLAKEVTPQVAAQSGFRPADEDAKPVAPIDAAHGVDPNQPSRVLGLPEPRVLAAIKKAWQEDRRPANVMIVLDKSGSMNDEGKLESAKSGLRAFLKGVGKQDKLGLTVFSDQQKLVAQIGTDRSKIRSEIDGLVADGGTTIYDSAADSFDRMRALNDKERINAVVLLTDGEDTDSRRSIEDTVAAIRAQGDSPNHVRIFTIAYGSGASGAREDLQKIAAASGGQSYVGSTENIDQVYRQISSFF